jgi:endonuclease/exonuclease/phosphatase family metal-dependent hydrolase
MGPVGHLYLSGKPGQADLERLAEALVKDAAIPAVFSAAPDGTVRAWNARGRWRLPEDAEVVLGKRHPFLHEVSEDLIDLIHHPDSGTLVLSGWRVGTTAMTFPNEHGSHAGPGHSETAGFALLPSDAPITLRHGRYARASDLAESARRLLNRTDGHRSFRPDPRKTGRNTLRVMTYNVHSCLGMDGRVSPGRLARIIARYSPDLVALQEVDVGQARTGGVDQAHAIAQKLEMEFHFHPAYRLEEEQYGDAVLSMFPMKVIKAGPLPGAAGREPRGAIWIAVEFNGRTVHLLNTHIGLRRRERKSQVDALLGGEWLGNPDCKAPVILCGDFNTLPVSPLYRKIARRLLDVQTTLENHRLSGTWLGLWRIDHVFVSPDVQIVGINVPRDTLTRSASDHLPLVVDIAL